MENEKKSEENMKAKSVKEASEAGRQGQGQGQAGAGSVAACPECVYLSNQPDLKYTQTGTEKTHTHKCKYI